MNVGGDRYLATIATNENVHNLFILNAKTGLNKGEEYVHIDILDMKIQLLLKRDIVP